MPIKLTKKELLQVVSGQSICGDDELTFEGIHFDSRLLGKAELFICLPGVEVHGHNFLDKGFEAGASLALVEDQGLLATAKNSSRLIYVPDTQAAFTKLGMFWRAKSKIPLLGVTGSVGKTTTKSMAASVLSQYSSGTASVKSFNNHIGVPFTLCSISSEDKWAVLEMGMNHAHELSVLSGVAKPDAAIITCIAPVHMEFFSTISELAETKFEIFEGLAEQGTAILNGDDAELRKQHRYCSKNRRSGKTLWFGRDQKFDAAVSDEKSSGFEGISFRLSVLGKAIQVKMNILGIHNSLNAAAAVLGALSICPDLSLQQIQDGLEQFKAPLSRLNVISLRNGSRILDDAYNASPTFMRAALDLLVDMQGQGKRVGLLLGSMNELGDRAEEYHNEIAELLRKMEPSFLVTVGELAALYGQELKGTKTEWIMARDSKMAAEESAKRTFDILLVKGSRAVGLDQSIARLKELLKDEAPKS